ncbi:pyruvate dehydrogenase [Engelhardtia mirabilis]|uniref:Pyruvate dehydrogenase E1 component n=1 Tax=Engelhardtia mirabilis TaxID=2528011 RepID=A0A518BJA2_9BACT|nr:Pyruvate dehydrogenase E1 component [Planctomycetes bacterium Pla133]QDV01362.1 Pyruvate dehydrogenase E1 component [Planctomycetes bacterium Pla86]
MTTQSLERVDLDVLNRIADRAFAQMIAMIHIANNRKDKQPGDPKVGGHPAACASCFHLLGALHLVVREVDDFVACKPHASPIDHAYHNLLRLFRRQDGTWLTDEDGKAAMERLRKFAEAGQSDVFQSYHAKTDPDSFHFLPSGTVGIPPVNSIYLALAHRFAADHGHEVPKHAHFWSLMGDSEFREGSLLEAMPEAAERELGNVTWIIDYNRQSLDGTRITNEGGTDLKDCDRIERTALANGWKVIQLRHGRYRQELFELEGGGELRRVIEHDLTDYEFQLLLFRRDAAQTRSMIGAKSAEAGKLLESLSDEEVLRAIGDVGAHDMEVVIEALEQSRTEPEVPYLIIAHTIKGWGLECFADPANHSSLPSKQEVTEILERNGLSWDDPFAHFDEGSDEAAFLAERQERFRDGIEDRTDRARRQRDGYRQRADDAGGTPETLAIDLSMFPMVHTQQMWGQLAAKLIRIGTHGQGGAPLGGAASAEKELTEFEARWQPAAELFMTLSPDVGTSTNIAPTMNSRIYGPGGEVADGDDSGNADSHDNEFKARHPELATRAQAFTRHVRFEIAEANAMSAAGSFGMMGKLTGVPLMPVMTVYDFFLKRALDQLYYNLYWGAEFVIIGTPSGVTLSPEGAQHSWKSDIQMPNLIAWEPFYAVEVDWILSDAIARQIEERNEGRSGVLIRGVTRALKQSEMLEHLRRHANHKAQLPAGVTLTPSDSELLDQGTDEASLQAKPDSEILESVRRACLAGAYYLIDWRGYAGYEPGDNVVQLFSMGSVTTEAVEASRRLLERGIYANVIVVTSPDLLCGILADQEDYRHLRVELGIDGDLHLSTAEVVAEAELIGLAGRRVPIVAVCDGEAGLLDNLGSIVGVRQVTCAVRRFSKCGRPDQVYTYQHLDADALFDACGRVLAETALENIVVSESLRARLANGESGGPRPHWRELWPAGQGDS